MKRERKLLILSGVLVVCVAGAVGVSRMDFEEKMTGKETTIVDVDSGDITRLSWNAGDDQLAFTREDGAWSYEADAKMSVDQDLLDEIAENLSHITSDKMVEEVQSLGVYGLSDPAYTVTIGTEDDTWQIEVGDETFSDGEVYISSGDDYVYLTDAGLTDHISYMLLDCVQKEEIPEMESISEVRVDNEAAADIVYKEDAGYCYSDAYTYYLKDGDTYRNLDNTNTENALTMLSVFSWDACADYYADESELAAYGLAEPAAEVTITYVPAKDEEETDDGEEAEDEEEQTFSYQVGTKDNAFYAKLTDSHIVYSVTQDLYNAAVNASYEQLKPDEVILLDWDTVDSVEAELDGNVYTVEIGKDGEDDGYTCTLGGEEIAFQDVLDRLLDITIAEDSGDEEEDTDVPEEEPALQDNKSELKLTFHRNTDRYDTVELEFYQYDGSYCISVLDGEEMHYTNRSSVVDLKEKISAAILDSGADE
ncbi:DUF4340 domain-containing protein [Mordavella massiliensis]|uniref:DUF4340 domain-containing protein n=1 Tax=Mordavella massiliensis TaxID=1871024 RepID=A0A938XCJ8_9CLOT|nr:DUF4340 domain-containing protein [Mordavella massiliensis]MBM6948214.1 DUF4340 domain-containing protein [Mordavella massiliensis]